MNRIQSLQEAERPYEARFEQVFTNGYGRSAIYVGPRPPRAVRGSGPRLVDETGHEVLDLSNNFTVLVHGHAHPVLVEEARTAVADGTCFGLHNVHEVAHAEALLARLEGADHVRYTNTGTEATLIALRLARAVTGRDKVIVVSNAFHGMAEPTLAAAGAAHRRGIPAGVTQDTVEVALNDVDGLARAFARHDGDVAAVILDLIPNYAGLVPATPAFAAAARSLTAGTGALLIVDEVISLRLAWGGLQSEYGLRPDLTVLGKLIGGGFPVGALAGRADVMERLDPGRDDAVIHGGTFSGNPITTRVGLRALELLTPAAIEHIDALGERLRGALSARLGGTGWDVRGKGSLLRLYPGPDLPATAARDLWWAAYEGGVLVTPAGLATTSTPMTTDDADRAADVLVRAAERVADVA